MALAISFWLLAAVTVLAALAVVTTRSIFRAALFLVLTFFTIAGLYLTLNADFLAAVQVLIYVGAISILLILAILLTRDAQQGNLAGHLRLPALAVSLLLLVTIILSTVRTTWQVTSTVPQTPSTFAIAVRIFSEGGYILPLEIAALLLLVALIGAMVMVREK